MECPNCGYSAYSTGKSKYSELLSKMVYEYKCANKFCKHIFWV